MRKLSDQRPSAGGGTGSTTLAALTDVNIPAPNDGDVLTYDSASGKWIAAVGGGAVPSASVSPSASESPSASASATGSQSASVSPSASASRSLSPSASASASVSPSASESPSASVSATPSLSVSPSASLSASPSPSPIGATGHRIERFAMFSPPAGGSTYPLIKAPAAYTVKAMRAIHSGSGSVSINGIKNKRGSASDVLASDLASSTTWQTSSTVTVALAAGDELDVELIGVTGYVEHVVVQVDYEETL